MCASSSSCTDPAEPLNVCSLRRIEPSAVPSSAFNAPSGEVEGRGASMSARSACSPSAIASRRSAASSRKKARRPRSSSGSHSGSGGATTGTGAPVVSESSARAIRCRSSTPSDPARKRSSSADTSSASPLSPTIAHAPRSPWAARILASRSPVARISKMAARLGQEHRQEIAVDRRVVGHLSSSRARPCRPRAFAARPPARISWRAGRRGRAPPRADPRRRAP